MSHLGDEFQKQGDPELRSLLSSQVRKEIPDREPNLT